MSRSLVAGVLTLVVSLTPNRAVAQEAVALIGATVIDGTGRPPLRNATVVVDGERITAIGSAAEVPVPGRATRINVAGKYLLPGFIDLHAHLSYPPDAGRQTESLGTLRALHFMGEAARAGVTGLRDVGGTIEPMQALLQAGRLGYVKSARLFPVGQLITSTGGHGTAWSYFASGPQGFREAVRTMYEAGFRHIKLSPYYTQEEVDAAVDEAKTRGMRVTSHGGGYSDSSPLSMTRRAVLAGVQCIEHVNDMEDDVLAMVADRGIHVVPTLAIYRTLYGLPQRPPTLQELIETRGWSVELHEGIFKKAMARGVLMGIGTDAVGSMLDTTFPQIYFEEMEYFVHLGMSRLDAIRAATHNGAVILGRDADLGTIEPGKFADLQVLDEDPLESFDALGNPILVMIGGEVVHRRE